MNRLRQRSKRFIAMQSSLHSLTHTDDKQLTTSAWMCVSCAQHRQAESATASQRRQSAIKLGFRAGESALIRLREQLERDRELCLQCCLCRGLQWCLSLLREVHKGVALQHTHTHTHTATALCYAVTSTGATLREQSTGTHSHITHTHYDSTTLKLSYWLAILWNPTDFHTFIRQTSFQENSSLTLTRVYAMA